MIHDQYNPRVLKDHLEEHLHAHFFYSLRTFDYWVLFGKIYFKDSNNQFVEILVSSFYDTSILSFLKY